MRPSPLASINCTPGSASARPAGASRHLAGQVEAAVAQVAPVADGAVHLQDVGQAVAEEIGQFIVWLGQRSRRKVRTRERAVIAPNGLKACVSELKRWQLFCLRAVVACHLDLAEQRDPVSGQPGCQIGQIGPLVEVDQIIGADDVVLAGMRGNRDAPAALRVRISNPARYSEKGYNRRESGTFGVGTGHGAYPYSNLTETRNRSCWPGVV